MFLGSFENETITTPVVTESLIPKSPSETDLLLYLGIHFDQYSLFLLQICWTETISRFLVWQRFSSSELRRFLTKNPSPFQESQTLP